MFQDYDGLLTGGFGTTDAARYATWYAKVASGATTRRERLDRLNRRALGRKFYDRVGGWFMDSTNRREAADLRHLMRIVFCRLLASWGRLTHWTMEPLAGGRPKRIHEALTHLFGTILADPDEAERHDAAVHERVAVHGVHGRDAAEEAGGRGVPKPLGYWAARHHRRLRVDDRGAGRVLGRAQDQTGGAPPPIRRRGRRRERAEDIRGERGHHRIGRACRRRYRDRQVGQVGTNDTGLFAPLRRS